ncbi:Acg family FMN-binding oxidoreductase [Mycolicibacterium psychrotolerans]|uniref:Putative NAD(P)H nitroreductase acg n=1 Tax=Mycolicibacterium psychrotolerans TaxID=216929 RepID=A0A7I7MHV0_9MYCO|nr:nitroreductase family protein [Mycolicibacterium psychrotolerans]BBX71367.1 putative NAD(P)H nitroreductase acg [Mycolicibacterium psychrotolerans]
MRDIGVDPEVISDAVWLACRAPSLYNSQPWRWVVDAAGIELFADPDRAPARTDTSGREVLIACGAVLDHFRVAMAVAGWMTYVESFPNPNNLDHVATIGCDPMDFVTDGHRQRADAILRRHTDRLPFAAPPQWDAVLGRLAEDEGRDVRIDAISREARRHLADASALTVSARLYDSSYHAELLGWTSDVAVAEGIPASSLLTAGESERVDIGRRFPTVRHDDRRAELAEDHAEVVVLSTYDDNRHSVLRCGEVLSAVLLDATMAGLATCPLTHLTEVPASREILAELIGHRGHPQVVVRVGVAPGHDDVEPPTPRRRLDDVLEFAV